MEKREIVIEHSGLVSILFPTNRPDLINFIKRYYPDEFCIMKMKKLDVNKSGIEHERWYFEPNDGSVCDFISQLKANWKFKRKEKTK